MSGYLLSVVGTVIFSALITAIMPEGKTSGLIKAIARMVCVLAIIAPVLAFFKNGSLELSYDKKSRTIFSQSVIEEQGDFIQYYSEMRVSQTQEALSQELLQKYGVKNAVCLEWTLQEDKIKITRILVDTGGRANEEIKGKMNEYLTNNYCSEVLIE